MTRSEFIHQTVVKVFAADPNDTSLLSIVREAMALADAVEESEGAPWEAPEFVHTGYSVQVIEDELSHALAAALSSTPPAGKAIVAHVTDCLMQASPRFLRLVENPR
jgi:hypothetical protein